jgi:polynucleotide 5'-kinase involved in rRNA processing
MSLAIKATYQSRRPIDLAGPQSSELVRLSSLLSKLRARFQPTHGTPSAQRERIDRLYEALWDRIVRAMGHAAVNNEVNNNWPNYFNGLRDVTSKVVGESMIIGLSDSGKAQLTRRLVESIDQLENEFSRLLELADK